MVPRCFEEERNCVSKEKCLARILGIGEAWNVSISGSEFSGRISKTVLRFYGYLSLGF